MNKFDEFKEEELTQLKEYKTLPFSRKVKLIDNNNKKFEQKESP